MKMLPIDIVSKVPERFCIGQTVGVTARLVFTKINRRMFRRGIIKGIYDHHVLVQFNKYCESFSYLDIALGRVKVDGLKTA
ncbi:MAG TPA: hypothetical protein GYA03_02765 [Tissierellia bacterium]|nr:hypothetical protein [Tissierellia bacterium]